MERALELSSDCAAAYRQASSAMQRQFNLAFFDRLLIDEDYDVTGELAKPFDGLLGNPLRRAALAQADEELQVAVEEVLRKREEVHTDNEQRPQTLSVGANSPTTSDEAVGGVRYLWWS